MTLQEAVRGRRSIRKYADRPVSKEVLEEIVADAAYAPSWKNTQTVRYVAVTDPELKDRIAADGVLGFEKNGDNIRSAPVLIIQTTVDNRSGFERDGSFSTSKGTHWQSYDAGIAAEAFCLAAFDRGLGTLIMGIFDEKKVLELAGIPDGQSVSALIALGYPDNAPAAPKRKEVSDLLTFKG